VRFFSILNFWLVCSSISVLNLVRLGSYSGAIAQFFVSSIHDGSFARRTEEIITISGA
jgi:hypothetical protein